MVRVMQVIHEHVEAALRELADERGQRRLWLSTGANGAEVSSFDECVCRLFNDSGLVVELDRDRVAYTQPIDDMLTSLRHALRRVDGRRAPQAVIEDPNMAELRDLARAILRLMNDARYDRQSS